MLKLPSAIFNVAVAVAIALPAGASELQARKVTHSDAPAASVLQKASSKSNPTAFPRRRAGRGGTMPFSHYITGAAAANFFKAAPSLDTEAGGAVDLRASIVYSRDGLTGGLYKIPTSSVGSFELVADGIESNYGGVVVDGVYYATVYDDVKDTVRVISYDTETWTEIDKREAAVTFMAFDSSADPVTGRVYGCFYNDGVDGFVFGYADYETLERVAIAPLPEALYGVAVDADGTVYGINRAGVLFTIDTTTGSLTKVGNSGAATYYQTSAAIDPASGRLYYAVSDVGVGALYEIDKATARGTLLTTFPGEEELCGLYVQPAAAQQDAPAAVSDLKVAFDGASLSGSVSFKAPTTYFNGTAASGELDYEIKVDNETVARGVTEFGAAVSESVTLPRDGEYQVAVTVSNSVGTSPAAKTVVYAGHDAPVAPEVEARYADGSFTVTWNPVTAGIHGGYVDAGSICYDVTRYPDEAVVARGVKETTIVDAVAEPVEFTVYRYAVVARNVAAVSESGFSGPIALGAVTPPFAESFDTEESMGKFTVIDSNYDGKTWRYDEEHHAARADYNEDLEMNDWLVIPPVRMEGGRMYRISFRAYGVSADYSETIEVKWGNSSSVESMTRVLVEPTVVATGPAFPMLIEKILTPDADGVYYFGFHGMSEVDRYNLFVDDITVSAPLSEDAPEGVADFNVTPDAGGALAATVSFVVPDKTIGGSPLAAIDRVEVSRDGDVIKVCKPVSPGEAVSFVDNSVSANGVHSWEAVVYNAGGHSNTAKAEAFVGVGLAGKITEVSASETAGPGEVALSWTAPETDINGRPLNPDLVSYNIYLMENYYTKVLVKSGVAATTYTYQALPADASQQFLYWVVFPVTSAGEGDGTASNMIPVGRPDSCPFTESFADKSLVHPMAFNGDDEVSWGLYGDTSLDDVASKDGDNGYAMMYGSDLGMSASLITAKIKISETTPAVVFYTYNIAADDNNKIEVSVISEGVSKVSVNVVVNKTGPAGMWNRVVVPLTQYAGKTVQLSLRGIINSYAFILVDDLFVGDIPACDLAVTTLSAPAKVRPGQEFRVRVKVENRGINIAEGYEVELYENEEKVATKTGARLAAGASEVVEFEQVLSIASDMKNEYYAVVSYDADGDAANNRSENAVVTLMLRNYPAVGSLAGEPTGDGIVLSWSEPDMSDIRPEVVVEDFEEAGSFATSYGDWTFLDIDGDEVGGFDGIDIPCLNVGKDPATFFVFDASLPQFNQAFAAKSGDKYLASVFNYDTTPVDDWAISPLLTGEAQTVSFFAKSYSAAYPESMEILYSTGSLDPVVFIVVKNVGEVIGRWTEYEAELPAGAKYFAIRSYAADAFMLMIDDVTFTPEPGELSLMGYNIYRDGVRINDTPVEEPSFADSGVADGEHLYHVTAVYDKGESKPVSVSVAKSGIPAVGASAVTVSVVDRSIVVTGAEGHPVAVYAVDGKTVYSSAGQARTVIPVQPGIYIVKAATTVGKVIVK